VLSRRNAGQFRCLGTRSRDWVPDGERFPCLTSLFIDPLGPTRSSATSSSTCTPRTARPAPSPPTSSPWAGRHLLRRRGTCLAAPPGPTSRRSWPTRSPVGRLVTRMGEHPGAREDLNLRPSASHAGALSPDLQGQGVVRINDDHLLDGRRRHYTADQIRAGCTPGTARPRLALRHASPVNYLSLERRVGRLRPQPCRPAACAGL
jgi:hypothetical protein